ncbi:MAG TPA: hypothetical protein VFQ89_05580 [Candidatus Binatia bacterium]|nr:hypothetical protein [Candidatus Binatia bacterium]
MAGDHGVVVVERRVNVHGPHAINVAVRRGEGLDALLEFTDQIQQPTAVKKRLPIPFSSRGSPMRAARTTSANALARLRLLKNVISKSRVSEQTFTIYTLD